jgi:hypothetical protein
MFASKFVFKALVPALLIGAAGAVSAPTAYAANPGSCVFEKYAPVSVTPYSADENVSYSYGSYSFLRGAQLFVPAREGLTKEWLEASVQRALSEDAQKANEPTCQSPHVKNVQVTVSSAGTGFWVALVARDERSADSLLKWARGIVDQHKPAAARAR